MNVVSITGILVADPELKTTQSGISVCSFAVAVKRPHQKDKTDFIDVVLWRETAEFFVKYFHKGNKVELSGHLETRTYETNGVKKKATELMADYVGFGDRKQTTDGSTENVQSNNSTKNTEQNTYNPYEERTSEQHPSEKTTAQARPSFSNVSSDDELPF